MHVVATRSMCRIGPSRDADVIARVKDVQGSWLIEQSEE